MKDIEETKLNLQHRSDLLDSNEFDVFEERMRAIVDKRIGDMLEELKSNVAKFQGGKWLPYLQNFDEMEWWSNYGDGKSSPFQNQIASDLNNWILIDPNLNLKSAP